MRPPGNLPHRPRAKDRRHGQLLKAVTERVVEVYSTCSGEFTYSTGSNPKRTLTWPCEGVHNSGLDNAEHNYICHVGDKIVNDSQEFGKSYEIIENLGQGSFGQVLKCQVDGSPPVALKISKNKPAYFNQGCIEANVLKRLNCFDTQHIVRMLDCFVFRKHLCIAFELLSMNLLEFLKWNKYRRVAMPTIQTVTKQLLKALQCLRDAALIHCDLKPENVMVCTLDPIRIKLIDFGSACAEFHMMHTYIQSRFYRSPEVLLGLPYSSAIDLWSLGCICAELNLGLPLFTGQCEYDQIRSITKLLGLPPAEMLSMGSKTKRYFRREEGAGCKDDDVPLALGGLSGSVDVVEVSDTLSTQTTAGSHESSEDSTLPPSLPGGESAGQDQEPSRRSLAERKRKVHYSWRLKTSEEYEKDSNKKAVFSKRSWPFTSLEEVVAQVSEESRSCFLQFLTGLFQINPKCRWTAKQALQHSFVNEEVPFDVDYQPPHDDVGPVLGWSPLMGHPASGLLGPACPAPSAPGHAASSTTGTPASSPHGSASSTVMSSAAHGTSLQGYVHVSSPWHLASPMDGSASECRASSQPSGSESWGLGSDTSGSCRGLSSKLSDSDSASAVGSHHGSGREETGQRRRGKEPRFWKQMTMARGRLESACAWSPKGAPSGGSFREAVGMGESGPVIVPVGPQNFTKPSGGPEDAFLVPSEISWRSHGKGGRRMRRRRGPAQG
ncbi:YAK1 [Symbiodinium microadriaticum]|nr:YAK1 [Symbiodinium microadriaticum]